MLLIFNGVSADTGDRLLPPMPPEDVARLARGETLEPAHLSDLRWRSQRATRADYGVKAGVDASDLAQAGWGVIFAHDGDPAVRDALLPLLALRQQQAASLDARRFREFTGLEGHLPGESKNAFLARHGIGPGPVDPNRIPYYLLIVGNPERIPYRFQYQLDVAYAVGRIHFDAVDDYARYALSVVGAETTDQQPRPHRATFFGVRNPDDPATALSADQLVAPLAAELAQQQPNWVVETILGESATRNRLADVLGGQGTPRLLVTASHGLAFSDRDPRQSDKQGALLCQDWPGPVQHRGPIPREYYFAADDVSDNASVGGLISFHFACFAAGTPRFDDFSNGAVAAPNEIASNAFVARLPRRLLAHPRGGALAVVGHVERAWSYSFQWAGAGAQREVFRSALQYLMEGRRVGAAMEFFNERYAEIATVLNDMLQDLKSGKAVDATELAGQWTANNDARNFVVIGDPAVKLPDPAPAQTPVARVRRAAKRC